MFPVRYELYLYIYYLEEEAHLIMNGRNIPFVNHVKYLGVIFD
jgi:hypothetical protein